MLKLDISGFPGKTRLRNFELEHLWLLQQGYLAEGAAAALKVVSALLKMFFCAKGQKPPRPSAFRWPSHSVFSRVVATMCDWDSEGGGVDLDSLIFYQCKQVCFSSKKTIKVCVSWSWRCPGTFDQAFFFLIEMFNPHFQENWRHGSLTKRREFLGGMKEDNIFSADGYFNWSGPLIFDCTLPAKNVVSAYFILK